MASWQQPFSWTDAGLLAFWWLQSSEYINYCACVRKNLHQHVVQGMGPGRRWLHQFSAAT